MGEPVSIIGLARDMIELSGLEPDRDIAIEVTGRRPGEKLHEELFNPHERPQPTPAEKIVHASRVARESGEIAGWFAEIELLTASGDAAALAAKVAAFTDADKPQDAAAAAFDQQSSDSNA